MIVNFTDDLDLNDLKKLYSVDLVAAAGAATVNFRRGSLAGAIVLSIPLAANEKYGRSYSKPLLVQEGIFIECTAAITLGTVEAA